MSLLVLEMDGHILVLLCLYMLCVTEARARSQALASHSEQIWGGGVSQS